MKFAWRYTLASTTALSGGVAPVRLRSVGPGTGDPSDEVVGEMVSDAFSNSTVRSSAVAKAGRVTWYTTRRPDTGVRGKPPSTMARI